MYDKKNTDDMVQRYKEEMMKLYRQNNPAVQGAGQSKTSNISPQQNNVAGSSAGKTMGTSENHSKFPAVSDISAEQNNPPSSKFRSAEDIMKNLAVPAIAINEMPPRSVTNRDDEDTYPVEDDGSDYEKEEQTESDEEDFSDMPRPPDIEVPPEVLQQLEQNRTVQDPAPFVRDRSEEYSTDITTALVNETGDTDTGYCKKCRYKMSPLC